MQIGGGDHMALNVAIVLGQLLDVPRSWEVLESVAERYAVMHIYQNLYPYLLKWQRSRICH